MFIFTVSAPKSTSSLYFSCDLRAFSVDDKTLILFYRSITESVLRYGITAWFGNLSVKLKSQLPRLMRPGLKTTGSTSLMISTHDIFETVILTTTRELRNTRPSLCHRAFHCLRFRNEQRPLWQWMRCILVTSYVSTRKKWLASSTAYTQGTVI